MKKTMMKKISLNPLSNVALFPSFPFRHPRRPFVRLNPLSNVALFPRRRRVLKSSRNYRLNPLSNVALFPRDGNPVSAEPEEGES